MDERLPVQVTKETADMMEGNGGGDGDDVTDALNATAGGGGGDGETGDDDDDEDDGGVEYIGMAANVYYLAPVLRMFAMLHSFAAIAMMIGYYYLKVGPSVGGD